MQSLNKGRTLESWVGKERAQEIRHKMSENSKSKAPHLKRLNEDARALEKRKVSRRFHEAVVQSLVREFRALGWRCYTLSEYVKEERTPDAILFDGKELVALEVELKKRWKPSDESMTRRLTDLNDSSRFFDRTTVVFPDERTNMAEQIPSFVGESGESQKIISGPGNVQTGGMKIQHADPRESAAKSKSYCLQSLRPEKSEVKRRK